MALLTPAPPIARRNLLVNPSMERWARGIGPFTTAGVVTADAWYLVLTGSTGSVSRDSANADAGSWFCAAYAYTHVTQGRLAQNLEISPQLRGRTVALAMRVKTSVANAVRAYVYDSVNQFRYSAYHSGGGGYETLVVVAPIDAASTLVQVGPWFSASCTAYIDNATLAVGDRPLEFAPEDPSEEVRRCKRYYHVAGEPTATDGWLALLQAYAATVAFGPYRFPVEMFATPSATVSAVADWAVYQSGDLVCTDLQATALTRRGCRLTPTVAGGLTAGVCTGLYGYNANARIRFEANV